MNDPLTLSVPQGRSCTTVFGVMTRMKSLQVAIDVKGWAVKTGFKDQRCKLGSSLRLHEWAVGVIGG